MKKKQKNKFKKYTLIIWALFVFGVSSVFGIFYYASIGGLGDMPDLLAVGYLLNQNMLKKDDVISEINYDKDLQVVIIRTERQTNYEKKMEKKIRTSGCAVGTVYGDIMDDFSSIHLNPKAKIKTSWIYNISKKVNTRPSLYLKAGALHGCVLCHKDTPLIYVEDVADIMQLIK